MMKVALAFACVVVLAADGASAGPVHSPEAQAKLDSLLNGRVAGETRRCIAVDKTNHPIGIDDATLLFRDGTNRVWINKPAGGCNLLSAGPYALVTRNIGGMGLCRGDIAHVVDTLNHSTVGTCVINDFIPYMRR